MMVLVGQPALQASQTALAAFAVERALAKFSTPADQLNDPFATYNMLNVSGLQELAPHLSWSVYLQAIGVPAQTQGANVGTPEFFKLVDAWSVRPETGFMLRAYLQWQLVHYSAPFLSRTFVDENFRFFGTLLTGQDENVPRYEQCISFADQTLGELLGAAYVKVAFSPQAKRTVKKLVDAVESAMHSDIQSTEYVV
jgi:putative endopeptidase